MGQRGSPRKTREQDAPLGAELDQAGTIPVARSILEEDMEYKDVEGMSEEELLEVEKMYRLSAPIRIPTAKLDDAYTYRWINVNPKNYRNRRGKGWKPCPQPILETLLKPGVKIKDLHMGTGFKPDGTLWIGEDLVFCYISTRVVNSIRRARSEQNRAKLRAGKQRFHEAGVMTGVETYDRGE